jgi:enediyne biosynthesis protein E4
MRRLRRVLLAVLALPGALAPALPGAVPRPASAPALAVELAPLAPRVADPAAARAFTRLSPESTGVSTPSVFDDPRMWGARFRELTLGAVQTGIAVADFDRDGRPDFYAVSKNGPCSLYRQVAPFRFVDVASQAGVAIAGDSPSSNTGVSVIDINQDGWPDLYVCRYDLPNLLFVNRGDGTFVEEAAPRGLAIRDASVHAVFADYDLDGDLDAYLVTNILDFSQSPQGRRDYLLRNRGDGTFEDVTESSGIWGRTQGHSAIWFDSNHDGWPDLYVANDFETPDRFYLNRGDGTFVDVVDERLPHVTYFSMGVDAGDVNNDGRMDFLVADMRDRTHAEFMTGMEEIGRGLWEIERVADLIPQYMWNALYVNTGTDRFLEAAHHAGFAATGWTWSPRFGDLDCDGRLDLFVTSGMIRNFLDADLIDRQNIAPNLAARAAVWKPTPPRRESTLAYRGLGDLGFEDVSSAWGLDEVAVSFGCALADLDGDGDLDLVYTTYEAPPSVVRNDTLAGHRVIVRLEGRSPNREGIGAEVRVETASGVQVRQLFPERGIASSDPAELHFGLGGDDRIRRLWVRWPRGAEQVIEDLPTDHRITVREPEDAPHVAPALLHTPARRDALLAEVAAERGLPHVARPRPFDELIRQRLLPRRLNTQAPALASADVNGDGHADLFVSGGPGQSGQLFLAGEGGRFSPAATQPWSESAEADDVAAVFLDANGDSHPDLFLSSGGVQREAGDPLLDDRVYINDGRGTFRPAPAGAVPADGASSGPVTAADVDGDGRTDLFVGGRVTPGRYPESPPSRLLRNTGGRFEDVTRTLAPDLLGLGRVTAAAWGDLDGDGDPDLVLAREWGAVTVLDNAEGRLEDRTADAGLAPHLGWWSALALVDVNGDGRLDLLAGNVGRNTKYRASAAEPAVLYAGDLDGSERLQLVEAHHENGHLLPVRGRSKLAYAFPWIPRKFPTFRAWSRATLDTLFDPAHLAAATRLEATELASGVFLQQADGRFRFVPFPAVAQLAPIHTLVVADFDGDGQKDILAAGNDFGREPTTGRFDGSMGTVLLGDGRGGFVGLDAARSGLGVSGEVRSALALSVGATTAVAVARADGPLLLFIRRPSLAASP